MPRANHTLLGKQLLRLGELDLHGTRLVAQVLKMQHRALNVRGEFRVAQLRAAQAAVHAQSRDARAHEMRRLNAVGAERRATHGAR